MNQDAYVVKDFTLVVTIECKQCEAGAVFHVYGETPTACPACGAGYVNVAVMYDTRKKAAGDFIIGSTPPADPPSTLRKM